MLIDFQRVICDLKGEPLKIKKNEGDIGESLKLLQVCQESLMTTFPDEQGLGGTEKVKRFGLALKIDSQLPVNLESEEIAEIKKLVGKAYGPLVVGRAWELLEAKAPVAVPVPDAAE